MRKLRRQMLISSSIGTTLIVSKLTRMKRDTGTIRVYNLLSIPLSRDDVLKATKSKEQLIELIVNKVKTHTAKIRNTITVTRKDLIPFKITNRPTEE